MTTEWPGGFFDRLPGTERIMSVSTIRASTPKVGANHLLRWLTIALVAAALALGIGIALRANHADTAERVGSPPAVTAVAVATPAPITVASAPTTAAPITNPSAQTAPTPLTSANAPATSDVPESTPTDAERNAAYIEQQSHEQDYCFCHP